jgi:hypothetical protein
MKHNVFAFKRTWNENHGKTRSVATGQAEIGQKRGEIAAREWRRCMARNVINDRCEFGISLKRTIGQGKAFFSSKARTTMHHTHTLLHANRAQIANCSVIFAISSSFLLQLSFACNGWSPSISVGIFAHK